MKGTPGAVMWVLNVIAIFEPPPSNLTDGYLSSLKQTILHILFVPAARVSLSSDILYLLLHSGGLAERLNRLQRRQRSAVSFWRHQSISDTSTTATGDPHKPPIRSAVTPTNHCSCSMMNADLWVGWRTSLSKRDSLSFLIERRGHAEGAPAVRYALRLWTVNSICRWQETAYLGLFFFLFFFSFPWCTKALVLFSCQVSPYYRTQASGLKVTVDCGKTKHPLKSNFVVSWWFDQHDV